MCTHIYTHTEFTHTCAQTCTRTIAMQEAKRKWDLHHRLADISADLEVLTREVGATRAA